MASLYRKAQNRDIVRHSRPAHIKDAAHLGALDLHIASFATQLHGCQDVHGNAGSTDRMPLGLQTARRVNRQLAVATGPAFLRRGRPGREQSAHGFIFE